MNNLRNLLPNDSFLHAWLDALGITEVPTAYQLATGLAVLGNLLRRNTWVDQVRFQVYPNLSILLVGPSGIGKDTAINAAMDVVDELAPSNRVEGRTIEALKEQMLDLGDPAVACIPAQEVSAFFGKKDYQEGLMQEMTDLLSNPKSKDVTLKGKGKRTIMRPTITMLAGSTKEWLQRAMPEGSLEGGLWPRFLIVCEEYVSKHVPLIKHDNDPEAVERSHRGFDVFRTLCAQRAAAYTEYPNHIMIFDEAQDMYRNWYINRETYFSPSVRAYAHRSRDQILRLAMLCAISRHHSYIDVPDIEFACGLMQHLAPRVEQAIIPVTPEYAVGRDIEAFILSRGNLPIRARVLQTAFSPKYKPTIYKAGMDLWQQLGRLVGGERGFIINTNPKES